MRACSSATGLVGQPLRLQMLRFAPTGPHRPRIERRNYERDHLTLHG